jgi:ribonuclease D
LSVLEVLCRYRDKLARKFNRPLFKVIGSRALYSIADACPETLGELDKIEDLSPRLAKRYGEGLIKTVKKGLGDPPIHLPKHKKPSRAYIKRLEDLKKWRKNKGLELGVQSDIILPRSILEDIAGRKPKNMPELKGVMAEVPWRFKQFGKEILKVVA